jgi:hypothetical protein
MSRTNRRIAHIASALTSSAAPPFSGQAIRMGSHLGQPARASSDARSPSAEVGTMKLFENERVRIWDVCLPPNGATGFRVFRHDTLSMQVGDGASATEAGTVPGDDGQGGGPGAPRPAARHTADRSCSFVTGQAAGAQKTPPDGGPTVNRLHNASSTESFRQILVEFLEPAPRLSAAAVGALLSGALHPGDIGSALLFENARCRVWDFSLPPRAGEDLPWHHHTLDHFFVNTCGGAGAPGEGEHGLTARRCRETEETFELVSWDRDLVFSSVPNGGFDAGGQPVHVDKVWNHRDVPYSSFIVEVK